MAFWLPRSTWGFVSLTRGRLLTYTTVKDSTCQINEFDGIPGDFTSWYEVNTLHKKISYNHLIPSWNMDEWMINGMSINRSCTQFSEPWIDPGELLGPFESRWGAYLEALITSYHLGTNISPPKVCLKMMFLFSRVKLLDGHSTAHIATKQNIPQTNFACHVSGGRVDEWIRAGRCRSGGSRVLLGSALVLNKYADHGGTEGWRFYLNSNLIIDQWWMKPPMPCLIRRGPAGGTPPNWTWKRGLLSKGLRAEVLYRWLIWGHSQSSKGSAEVWFHGDYSPLKLQLLWRLGRTRWQQRLKRYRTVEVWGFGKIQFEVVPKLVILSWSSRFKCDALICVFLDVSVISDFQFGKHHHLVGLRWEFFFSNHWTQQIFSSCFGAWGPVTNCDLYSMMEPVTKPL